MTSYPAPGFEAFKTAPAHPFGLSAVEAPPAQGVAAC